MKILSVVASGRREGNVKKICNSMIKGAFDSKHEVEEINLFDYNINPCKGCYTCTKTRKCTIKDDFDKLLDLEKKSDYIIYGFPIYCHGIPGNLKSFIDRHAHAVIPFYDNRQKKSYWEKVRSAMSYLKGFHTNRPFINKKIIIVMACTNPNSNGKDIKNTKYVLNNFFKEMGFINEETIVCSDTLFRFKADKIVKLLVRAYEIGKKIK